MVKTQEPLLLFPDADKRPGVLTETQPWEAQPKTAMGVPGGALQETKTPKHALRKILGQVLTM